ncbi:uncharacterized protein LOC134290188 [Aedes albopictus]|uniref:Uncharacterized protein n=1 Tax=Aedes albopictus TaxID=7160 RepID=A0ABM1YL57_AEDAL
MSSGSVAGAGMTKSGSPGEGVGCGVCRRGDEDCTNSRMVQCDECNVWFHYDCVNVNDSIRDYDWSCNGCVRTTLDKQRQTLSEQMERLEQQQKQWRQEQQKYQDQTDEQRKKLEQWQTQLELQRRGQEQIHQSQTGQLQLQQQSKQFEATTSGLNTPWQTFGGSLSQKQQVRIVEEVVTETQAANGPGNTKPLGTSSVNNVGTCRRSIIASSKSSKRSAKLRELQTKALEARQALEKKQLEERLELEREMLELSESEVDSVTSLEKINEWLEKTENAGKEAGNSLDETPLPVYNELLRKTVVPQSQTCIPGFPVVQANVQQHARYSAPHQPCVSQQLGGICAPGVRYTENLRPSQKFAGFPPNYQPPLGNFSSMPVYTVASHQPTAYPATSYQHQAAQTIQHTDSIPQNLGHPVMSTSTPRYRPATSQQQYLPHLHSNPVPLDSSHLAARQTVKDLPKFGGDPEDWPRFIAAYERTSRMCAFRNDELLDRLERSLHDKALNAVKSLLLHPDNVPVIMKRLKTLFGNPESIVETMVRRIRMMPPPKAEKMETIIDFGVAVQNLCATIQVCQMDERLYNVALLQELVDSLPSALKMKWAFYRKEIGAATLLEFNNWLGDMVEAFSQVVRPAAGTKMQKPEIRVRKEEVYVHAHSLSSPEQLDYKTCPACSNECSSLEQCSGFLEMLPKARWALVNEKKICRKCLTKHFNTCERKVPCNQDGCSFLHHWLLHDDSKHKKPLASAQVQNASVNAHHRSLPNVLLKYIRVTLHGKGRSITTYAFFDSGSTSTLMEHSLWKELNLNGEKSPLCISWTGGQGRYEQDSVVFSADIASAANPGQRFRLPEVHTVRSLDLPEQSMSVTELAKHFQHLSDLPIDSYSAVKPRILLGVDSSRLEYPFDSREGSENQPTAVLTRLGWVVYGPCSLSGQTVAINDVSYSYHICQCEGLHLAVKNYFSLDSLGVQLDGKPLMSRDDERAMKLLQENTVLQNKRYETGLLWRYEDVRLPSSKSMALKRHDCLNKRMARDPVLAKCLQEKILDYQAKGYIRKLSAQEENTYSGRSWYLPIFPVVNPNKPGKLRIVWDAAAKVGNFSLNSFLLKGPDQVTPLQHVLQRFREYRTAVAGDIREMFHQVRIKPIDQHCQRFLWNDGIPGNAPSTYAMEVMTFGASCSPSSAQYVKNINAARFKDQYPEAVETICKGTYVDDMLDSVESEAEAVKLLQDVRYIHAEGGFEIRGWLSNSQKVLDSMGEQITPQKDLNRDGDLATEKVLGMWWDTISDTFTFKIPKRCRQELLSGEQVPTKREVLRTLMSVYDPLGLLANILMYLKVLLQEIWRSKIGWDEPIDDESLDKWRAWLRVLNQVETVSVPRCYRKVTSSSTVTNEVQLHVFVDTSEKGYAAVAYLRFDENRSVECAFVTAKTRVAPLKYISIPRLELQAAVVGTRLAKCIGETHRITVQKRFFWTDSMDVLCWLRTDHRRYSKFVGARVGEILEDTAISEWLWVPTKLNVADEGTKWQKFPDLSSSSRWFRGPDFMWQQMSAWPAQPAYHGETITERNASINVHNTREPIFNFANYSNWRKLLRITAYVLRFTTNLRAYLQRRSPSNGILKQSELIEAERYIYRQVQLDAYGEEIALLRSSKDAEGRTTATIPRSSSLYKLSPFLDDHGVLRTEGRAAGCKFIDPDAVHTILLPREHPITTLIIRFTHERYHHLNHETIVNELRQVYRIPKLRSVCNKIRRLCQYCKNLRAQPQPPVMADLPPARLAAYSRPFSYVGIDYFGPIQVVVGRRSEKRWGVLITCLVVRAIHIEIAHSLNTSSCIMALRNFMCRRGTPVELFSDRGTNFIGANRELTEALRFLDEDKLMQEFVTPHTKWTFLPPSSPHMGGSWERLVQSVKKILGNMQLPRTPTDEVLRNSLLEVENIINSRPLTYIPIDDAENEALTPNHFLLGSSGGSKPLVAYDSSPATLVNNWRTSQIYANIFWRRWLREYLPSISRRTKWHYPTKPIEVGDVVVITDPDLPRNLWPKGRVVDQ